MGKLLVACDFDYTIIEENSDLVVRNLLDQDIRSRLKEYDKSLGWTAYMDEVFSLLFQKGVSEEQLRNSVISIKPVTDFVKLFRDLKRINCDIIIISDANTYFIEEWLKYNGIRDCVEAVYSNPGQFEGGRLKIQKYHEQNWCSLSTINLCKGYILENHIANSNLKYNRVFYVGDGKNDLCPSLKLSSDDYIFPRIGFPLEDELKCLDFNVRGTIIPWNNTNQIWTVIEKFVVEHIE